MGWVFFVVVFVIFLLAALTKYKSISKEDTPFAEKQTTQRHGGLSSALDRRHPPRATRAGTKNKTHKY